jgi:glucosyl-3-phosphoglycerate synthase
VGDFHQSGTITTLHNLTRRPLEELEAELVEYSKVNPIGLVLPSLYSELEKPALEKIVQELRQVPYLSEIVIGLDRADEDQFKRAKEYFSRLPQHHRVLWNDGPRAQAIDAALREEGLAPKQRGKGCNVWYCFGYMLASQRSRVVALHDCDITTYDRGMLARLVYPVARPSFSFYFCKGYYARAAGGKLHGRVSRLFVTPIIRTLKRILGQVEYLDYLDSFRYPLAGEFSLHVDVLRDLRIPSDWGLEIGVLSEVQRNYSRGRLCQVDVADVYDHKHQDLSVGDPTAGLAKMSNDIAKALFRKLATQGHVFTQGTFRSIKATYYRIALDFVEAYHKDALMNGLGFDRHAEEKAVEVFLQSIVRAGEQFLHNPMETPFIPSWNRVASARPSVLQDLVDTVESDMA